MGVGGMGVSGDIDISMIGCAEGVNGVLWNGGLITGVGG